MENSKSWLMLFEETTSTISINTFKSETILRLVRTNVYELRTGIEIFIFIVHFKTLDVFGSDVSRVRNRALRSTCASSNIFHYIV